MKRPQPHPPTPETAPRRPVPPRGRCPTCGRENAVLYYPLRAPRPGQEDRPVCLDCSPPPDEETKT